MLSRAWVCAPGVVLAVLAGCAQSQSLSKSSGYPPPTMQSQPHQTASMAVSSQPRSGKAQRATATAASSDPADGVHLIWANLAWHEATLPAPDNRAFRWAQVFGTNPDDATQQITLIVGAIDGGSTPGIKPPLLSGEGAKPGWDLQHCKGADGKKEIVTLNRGFMCVHVEGTDGLDKTKRFPIWPFIVRTKTIPAGAYSTSYVLLAMDKTDNTTREYVLRPNQIIFDAKESSCDNIASTDTSKSEVHAHPVNELDQTTQVPQCICRPDTLSPAQSWRDMSDDEQRFLKDVCAFYKAAMPLVTSNTGSDFDWNNCK
jgi:hypothetical protein